VNCEFVSLCFSGVTRIHEAPRNKHYKRGWLTFGIDSRPKIPAQKRSHLFGLWAHDPGELDRSTGFIGYGTHPCVGGLTFLRRFGSITSDPKGQREGPFSVVGLFPLRVLEGGILPSYAAIVNEN
jgi:hypothetical protein